MKRPSFQFYPSDWLRDTALRTCSIGARGLWIDMICFMHEGTPYGHLKVGNKVILPANLASMVGATLEDVEGWLDELHQANVFDLVDGVIMSRRMIRDEELRQKRSEGGKLGGNPALKVGQKVNLEDKQNPTPSSSSSSSSSSSETIKEKTPRKRVAPPDGVSDSVWQDFLTMRKAKKAPMTEAALEGIRREAEKAGWSLEDALRESCARGWQGFKADWVADKPKPVTYAQQASDVARATVPAKQGPDPALQKIIEDRMKAVPPPADVREKLAALRGASG